MNLDELRAVRREERQTDSLQHLRDSFYEDVAAYIGQLKDERERAAAEADDPFSAPEVSRLTDEIETAEATVESVYERRVGKVVKLASFAAADMPADEEGLTAEERALFSDLVERIKTNRETVLDVLAGESGGDGAPTDATPTPEATPDSGTSASDPASAAPEPAPDPTTSPDAASAAPSAPPESVDDAGVLADAMGGSEDGDGGDTSPPSADAASDDRVEVAPDSAPPGGGPAADAGSEPSTDGGVAADAPSGASSDGGAADTDRTMVRITRDVGEIFCVDDREYDLASDDVVTLPTANAEPLLDRDAAERLE